MNDIEQEIRGILDPNYTPVADSQIERLADLFREEVRSILDEIREVNEPITWDKVPGAYIARLNTKSHEINEKIIEINSRYCTSDQGKGANE
jgi:hypothetical protein